MKEIYLPETNIIGITAKASNSDTQNITALWEKFYSEGIKDKIPNKLTDEIISLYCDYEGDYTKPYHIVIGCRVSSTEIIPEGMTVKKIPAGKYAVFTAIGKMPEAVVNMWKHIWATESRRSYAGDFEVYGEKSANPQSAEVKIFIAIKE